VDVSRFNLAPAQPVMVLDPDSIDLSGDVTATFVRAAQAPF
jgi:choloylglycine hydrolase